MPVAVQLYPLRLWFMSIRCCSLAHNPRSHAGGQALRAHRSELHTSHPPVWGGYHANFTKGWGHRGAPASTLVGGGTRGEVWEQRGGLRAGVTQNAELIWPMLRSALDLSNHCGGSDETTSSPVLPAVELKPRPFGGACFFTPVKVDTLIVWF